MSIALTGLLLSSRPSLSESQRIIFVYKNVSDLRGLLNAFNAFQRACLDQPVTEDLPARLVPDGYRIVTPGFHLWGKETGVFPDAAILSRTGREESDFAGGYPIIELTMPTDRKPDGDCRMTWKRGWDYSDRVKDVMSDIAVQMDVRVSYHLRAYRVSRPDGVFAGADNYGIVSKWRARCWSGKWCAISVLAFLSSDDGIDLTLSCGEAPGEPNYLQK